MEDIRHDLHILISMAKIDASLSHKRSELGTIPDEKLKTGKMLADLEAAGRESDERLASLKKERRAIETGLEDSAELIKDKKTKLMQVKTNKEYSSLLKEIALVEQEIDAKEERLLQLMDDIEEQDEKIKVSADKMSLDKSSLNAKIAELAQRESTLRAEIAQLEAQKPALLRELDVQVKKRYDRLLAKMGDFAVTHVVDEICQGCFSRIPPQMANEVKMSDRILTCAFCGRILVHYES